jgi:hypothetical protein
VHRFYFIQKFTSFLFAKCPVIQRFKFSQHKITDSSDDDVGLITHATKIVHRVLRRTERKIEDVRGENQFGYRR